VSSKGLSHVYKIVLMKRVAYSFASGLSQNYISIYITKLGASIVQLGSLNTISSLISSFLALPLGWLADYYSLKKIYLSSLALTLLTPLIYFLARDWRITVIPILISHIEMWSISLLETIIIAETLPNRRRATGFGLLYMLSGLASIVSPTIAGLILSYLGGLNVRSIKILFFIQFLLILCTYTWVVLGLRKETIHSLDIKLVRDPINELRLVLRNSKIRGWLIVESLGGFIFGAVNPFIMVYAAEIKGADALILGLMGSISNLTYMFSSFPIGRLADIIGRRKTIALFRPFLYASMLLLILAPNKNYLLLVAALRGIAWGAMSAWSSLRMELVESSFRGIWSGIIGMLRGLARAPASLIGGLLWTLVSPSAPFVMLVVVDSIVRLPLVLSMPETLNENEKR